jgi:hypothetical protein
LKKDIFFSEDRAAGVHPLVDSMLRHVSVAAVGGFALLSQRTARMQDASGTCPPWDDNWDKRSSEGEPVDPSLCLPIGKLRAVARASGLAGKFPHHCEV